MAALLLFSVVAVGAQEKEAPFSKPYPMGQVTITLKSVGAGVGIEWGGGILTYKGKAYKFKVRGINVGALGISKAVAHGDVYNLFNLAEFPGHYMAAGASLAIFKGKQGQAFKNDKGVHIFLKAPEKGMELKIGPEGFTVRLEEVL
jgi:hypothetical protein